MSRRTILLGLPFLLLAGYGLAGCGGGSDGDGGCSTFADLPPNAEYAGAYEATYAPRSGTAGTREIRFDLRADGTLTGTVRDPSVDADFGGEVRGNVLTSRNDCGDGRTYVDLRVTLPNGTPEIIAAGRKGVTTLEGVLPVERAVYGTTTTIGDLTLKRAVRP